MTTYRTGNHHGVTVCAENDGARCDRPGHNCARGHLVGMVDNGQFLTGDPHMAARVHALLRHGPDYRQDTDWDLAERICALLNGDVRTDSCTCTKVGPDPACPVHQGRRARGPKPPPLGHGCICDGSGRTCPRHGAVL